MIWIVAILKAGAAFTVIDSSYPLESKTEILSLSHPAVMIVDADSAELTAIAEKRVVRITPVNQ